MRVEDGEIIAGLSISNFKLDITREELLDIIGEEYEESEINETDTTITIENAEFWITADGKVHQIAVWGDFQGKYRDIIGIGSTLEDVKKYIGNYDEEYDDYWDELKAPIESICVYREKEQEIKLIKVTFSNFVRKNKFIKYRYILITTKNNKENMLSKI